ncbi:MAG TPA: hypothetical protein DCR24_01375 [Bacillus bacterium]|nr:hypothetical protein [Bacillus sp. (in: firmicutes)]
MLHHLEIYVADLNHSINFWEWFLKDLQYQVFQKWEKGISWKSDNTYIVFVQAEEKFLEAGYHRSRIGLNHIAFHARSREHIDEMTAMLRERGIAILYEDRHPYAGGKEHYALYFEDPDRIKIELVAPNV